MMDRTQTGTKIIYIIYRASSPHLTREQEGRMYECLSTDIKSLFTRMYTPSLSVGPILRCQDERERKLKRRKKRKSGGLLLNPVRRHQKMCTGACDGPSRVTSILEELKNKSQD